MYLCFEEKKGERAKKERKKVKKNMSVNLTSISH